MRDKTLRFAPHTLIVPTGKAVAVSTESAVAVPNNETQDEKFLSFVHKSPQLNQPLKTKYGGRGRSHTPQPPPELPSGLSVLFTSYSS